MIDKVSNISVQDIADYLRIAEVDEIEQNQLQTFLNTAKDYIKNYTGLEDLDEYADLVLVVFVLCQDMYDNRTMYVNGGTPNRTVQTILDMHTRTNLC